MPNRWQAINWTNDDPVHRLIYVVLGGDELTHGPLENVVVILNM